MLRWYAYGFKSNSLGIGNALNATIESFQVSKMHVLRWKVNNQDSQKRSEQGS